MKPFTKILVPHDLSEHADQAVEVAADVARRYEANVTLLNVVEPNLYPLPGTYMLYPTAQLPAYLEAMRKKLDGVAQKLRAAGVMQVRTEVLDGAPVTEIVRYAADAGHDLIIMGTHGRTGISHALIGSVAERVVRTAQCPVLTVRTTAKKA